MNSIAVVKSGRRRLIPGNNAAFGFPRWRQKYQFFEIIYRVTLLNCDRRIAVGFARWAGNTPDRSHPNTISAQCETARDALVVRKPHCDGICARNEPSRCREKYRQHEYHEKQGTQAEFHSRASSIANFWVVVGTGDAKARKTENAKVAEWRAVRHSFRPFVVLGYDAATSEAATPINCSRSMLDMIAT
jgi:hypothetical protein